MLTDSQLNQRVLDELRWDHRFDASKIGVTTTDGAVTLTGHVDSYPQKFAATDAARSVRGVKAVADEIEVELANEHRTDDGEIAEHVAHVLSWNVSLPEESVKAKVRNGFVTLTGEVDWNHQRLHVQEQVQHVRGVRGIANLIAIRAHISSGDVKQEIEAALKRSAKLEADSVRIAVGQDGTVTLDGTVKSLYERDVVERAAWKAAGVRNVVDDLEVA